MSDKTCYFCGTDKLHHHGIHGAEEFDLCRPCRDKFVTMRFFVDPAQREVLGFECKGCGFTCDVPGKVEFNKERGEFELKVDSKHNYCQNCGTPSK